MIKNLRSTPPVWPSATQRNGIECRHGLFALVLFLNLCEHATIVDQIHVCVLVRSVMRGHACFKVGQRSSVFPRLADNNQPTISVAAVSQSWLTRRRSEEEEEGEEIAINAGRDLVSKPL